MGPVSVLAALVVQGVWFGCRVEVMGVASPGLGVLDPAASVPVAALPEHVEGRLFVLATPEGELESREHERDAHLLVAFTRLSLLQLSCGAEQPHLRMPPEQLQRAVEELRSADKLAGPVAVALDVWLPEGHRYGVVGGDEDPYAPEVEPLPADGLVWIPTRPVRRGDRRVEAELHGRRRGEQLLCVYESAAQLRQCCGPFQPGAAIHAAAIEEVATEAGASGVLVAPVLAEDSRHTGVVHTRARQSAPVHRAETNNRRGRRYGR